MGKKKIVAVALAVIVGFTFPFSAIAEQTGKVATARSKVAKPAKSRQAIAARQGTKRTPKKSAKRATSHRPAAKKQT